VSIRETGGRLPREKWPLSFDLEGIPRETQVREQKLKELRGETFMSDTPTMSHEQIEALREFLLLHDRNSSQNVFDLSKPPKEPYDRRGKDYPKMVYGHEGDVKGHVINVKSAEEEADALNRGYSNEPHPQHDYSRIDRNGMKAAEHESPRDEVTEDRAAAAQEHTRKLDAEEKKKARRS
jgi:hypothetical protein